ncbi:MAG TPA: ABC transporter permease [Vicinamibacterales bacterium]
MIDPFLKDVQYAARSLRQRPLVTMVAIVSLALGIGVNAAIFSGFDLVILRHLPIPDADQIVLITSPGPRPGSNSVGGGGPIDAIFSYPLFRDLERLTNTGLSGIAAHRDFPANLAYRGHTISAQGELVSGAYFPVLGVTPALGRVFTPDDDRVPGGHPVVVLSHRYWSTRFGSNPSVIGEALVVNGQSLTIIGVTAERFTGITMEESPKVFVPLAMADVMRPGWTGREQRNDHWLYLFGRLEPRTTLEQAQARMRAPFGAIIRDIEYPAQKGGIGSDRDRAEFQARRIILQEGGRGRTMDRAQMSRAFILLFAVTGFVLLIACANIANLLLARATDRSPEIALRFSMGASVGRVVRLLLTEACLLGLAGGIAAIAVCDATMRWMMWLLPDDGIGLAVDYRVLLFALSLGLISGCFFGLFPALHGSRATVTSGLQAQPGRTSGSRRSSRLRAALATTQIALATALLAEGGLLILSLVNVSRVDLGIRPQGLLTFSISPYLNGYTPAQSLALFEQIGDSIRGLPGVVGVTQSTVPILSNSASGRNVTVQGFDASPDTDTVASYAAIGEDYFKTLGMPLLQGREFTRADAGTTVTVTIVNEQFARKFNLTGHTIGARMALGAGDRKALDIEIVGLVRNAPYSQVREAPPAAFYMPYRQSPVRSMTYYVRTAGDPQPLFSSIAATVARADHNLPIDNLRTMTAQINENVSQDRVITTLATSFAGLATLLAGIGLYAMLAYSVARRMREMGIRIAFGARAADMHRLIFGHVASITIVGGAIGVAMAVALGQLSQAMLFGVSGPQPSVMIAAATVAVVVAFAAGIVPARRAALVNPVEALKAE